MLFIDELARFNATCPFNLRRYEISTPFRTTYHLQFTAKLYEFSDQKCQQIFLDRIRAYRSIDATDS